MYGIVTFTDSSNSGSFHNANVVINSGEYSGVLETVADIDISNPANTDLSDFLNINSNTTLFIKWTDADRTQFITITRITKNLVTVDEIRTTLDYILDNEAVIDAADGSSQDDIFDGNGNIINQGGGFGFGNGSGSMPWWLYAAVAVFSGLKANKAKGNTKLAWGALGTYTGIQAIGMRKN